MNVHLEKLALLAQSNLFGLSNNPYPGRGIVVGLDETGENMIQIYWIMGRSENSRNRIFVCDSAGRVSTEAADPSKVTDPSLIIYNAMIEARSVNDARYIVSNGHQTDSIASGYHEGVNLLGKLRCWEYEPDKPNFTPRITANSFWRQGVVPSAWISVLKKSQWGDSCDRHLYELNELGKGFGYCVTTYAGDGNPLPPFRGEPYLLPLHDNAHTIADTYWSTLNPDNRVSLAVKFISKKGPSQVVLRNKFEKV